MSGSMGKALRALRVRGMRTWEALRAQVPYLVIAGVLMLLCQYLGMYAGLAIAAIAGVNDPMPFVRLAIAGVVITAILVGLRAVVRFLKALGRRVVSTTEVTYEDAYVLHRLRMSSMHADLHGDQRWSRLLAAAPSKEIAAIAALKLNSGSVTGAEIKAAVAESTAEDAAARSMFTNMGVAIHEAGHALACVRLGVPITEATARTGSSDFGGNPHVSYAIDRPGTVGMTERRLIVSVAGQEASRIAGMPAENGSDSDIGAATASALMLQSLDPDSETPLDEIIRQARAAARFILTTPENRMAHLALTTTLIEHDLLSGADVLKVVADSDAQGCS